MLVYNNFSSMLSNNLQEMNEFRRDAPGPSGASDLYDTTLYALLLTSIFSGEYLNSKNLRIVTD